MRSDYALYIVAVIFFLITAISFAAFEGLERNLSVVATAVFGFLFAGLGFSLRPQPEARTTTISPPATVPEQPTVAAPTAPLAVQIEQPTTEIMEPQTTSVITGSAENTTPAPAIEETASEAVIEPLAWTSPLMEVRGIGAKRAKQLIALGITTIEGLSQASAKDLAENLKISPKITGKWITNAKELNKS